MNNRTKYYPSKVLLFGEYGILAGTKAFAIPYHGFKGKLELTSSIDKRLRNLYKHIIALTSKLYFKLNTDKLLRHIEEGLQFVSTIPLTSGLGSSGALVSALYDNYSEILPENRENFLPQIKSDLATIESYFHGESSGFDPLISYVDVPLLFEPGNKITSIDSFKLPEQDYHFFLIDSKSEGNTGIHVKDFLLKLKDKGFNQLFLEAYKKFSDLAIDSLLEQNYCDVFDKIAELSKFQIQHMKSLIPDRLQELFYAGINSGKFVLKICGSGGGGFFLGMVKSDSEFSEINDFPVYWLK